MRSVLSVLGIMGISLLGCGSAEKESTDNYANVNEQRLGKLPENILTYNLSPDGRHLAFVGANGAKAWSISPS